MSEKIWLVQIDQPLCRHRYGNGPCAAVLDTDNPDKCYNTRKSCQDPDNYAPDDTLTLTFAYDQQGVLQNYDLAIPCIRDVEFTPVELNLGTMNQSASPLGERESLGITCYDFLHSDNQVDPYRDERLDGSAQWVEGGTAQAGGTATMIKLASGANGTNDYYNGWGVHLNDGSGRTARITDYDGTTKVAAITPAWPTNFLTYANDYSNAAWTKVGGLNVTANGAYYTIEDDDGAAYEYLQQTVTIADDSEDYVASVVVAKTTGKTEAGLLFLNFTGGTGVNFGCYFNSNDGSVLNGYSAGASDVGFQDLGDRWRFWVKGTNNGTGNTSAVVEVYPAINSLPLNTTNDNSVTQSLDVRDIQLDNNATLGKFVNTVASAITSFPGATTDYSLGQPVDPYARGTFWGKWVARNPYHTNYVVRAYEGDMGDALSAMDLRYYRIDTIDGPAGGQVSIEMKDLISVVERQKAFTPAVSTGYLNANINDSQTSAVLAPTGVGNSEYPASGHIRINDEIMSFTRSGDNLTITRAQKGTDADSHDVEDTVQVCYVQTSQLAHDIIYDLLLNYTSLTTANLPLATWDIEMADVTGLYSGTVSEPTPTFDLVAELAEQVGITIFPDTGTDEIKMIPLRAQTAVDTIQDESIIGDVSVRQLNDRRVSQLWVYYGMKNFAEDVKEEKNYRSRAVGADLPAEGSQQYGTASVRKIMSRWIGQFGRTLALNIADRLTEQFRDPPFEAQFRVPISYLSTLELGRPINLVTSDKQSMLGLAQSTVHVVTSLERDMGELIVKTQQLQLTQQDITDERVIYIESDVNDVNLRTIHDLLYAAPTGVETVTFVLLSGVNVGSASTSSPALQTGSWPSGVTLEIQVAGTITGKGGAGGAGGACSGTTASNGSPGGAGGLAFKADYAVLVGGTGTIRGGGGGGGGGGGSYSSLANYSMGGGGGGGGRGTNNSAGGSGGVGSGGGSNSSGGAGGTGTTSAAGSGGAGGDDPPFFTVHNAGAGGAGGSFGTAGSNGAAGVGTNVGSGGAGGAAGAAISGISFVTYDTTSPTITGATS